MSVKCLIQCFAYLILALAPGVPVGAAEGVTVAGGPELGSIGRGSPVDKSHDRQLNKMIADIAPQFRQMKFTAGGIDLNYNLFTPSNRQAGEKYPLVLFIADASTPGPDIKSPIIQGYGGLIWATPEAQSRTPCYVLVPQFSGVAVNDDYERTPEVDCVIELLKDLIKNNDVDASRIYATGQSMGGMISMYYNITYPDIFAASLFVDCHWDSAGLDTLVQKPFIMVYAGNRGKAWQTVQAIEDAARKMSKGYTWSEWSARLPEQRQNELAATQLEKGQPINLIGFENGTVLPEGCKGSEHMYSFDYAYKLEPVREWLFQHSLPIKK